jgi:hypothetical protein
MIALYRAAAAARATRDFNSRRTAQVVIFATALAVFAWSFFALWCWFLWLSIQSRRWPTAPAELIAAEVETPWSSEGSTYEAAVQYRYTVDGKQYIGNRVHLVGYGSPSRKSAAKLVEQLQARAASEDGFHIYYDPRKHSRSVALCGAGCGEVGGLALSLVLSIVFTACAIYVGW